MTVRDRLTALVPRGWGDLSRIDRQAGRGKGWLWNRLNDKAPIYADDLPLIAEATGIRITDLYADTPAGQREIAERVEGLDREIVAALAGCSERQKRIVLDVIRSLRRFAGEGHSDG